MSKILTLTVHLFVTVYNEMFYFMDGGMRTLAWKKTQWKDDLFVAMKLPRQKLSKYYTEVTPIMEMLLITAHNLDSFQKLQLCRQWDKGMDINPEDDTSYTTQYLEAFLKYVENVYNPKHQLVPVNKLESLLHSKMVSSSTDFGSCQPFFDPYDLSSNVEEYLTPNNVAEMTPGQSDQLLTAATLYLNLQPEAPKNWGQINPNFNNYHSDPKEISSTLWIPDITDG
jgi:hypothetical protein